MKNLLFLSLFAILPFQKNLTGAWELKEGTITHTLVIADDYFSITSFDIFRKIFLQTEGGTCIRKGEQLEGKIEFNTNDKSTVGSVYAWPLQSINPVMTIIRDGKKEAWTRTDDGVEGRNWYHSGKSSKGDPISEVWSR